MEKLFITMACPFFFLLSTTAPQDNRKVRIAKIEIYPAYIEEYRAVLAEHAKTAVQKEPGVLVLQAVYDKTHPA